MFEKMNASATLLIFAMKTNTIYDEDKYNLQFEQIQFAIGTNTICNLDKYNLQVMLMFEKMNASVGLLVFQKMNEYPVSKTTNHPIFDDWNNK